MTFEEWGKKFLVDNGMFDTQADEVLNAVKSAKENEAMAQRWGDDIEGYPQVLLSVMTLTLKAHALIWIDANVPQAWYRPMFETSQQTAV